MAIHKQWHTALHFTIVIRLRATGFTILPRRPCSPKSSSKKPKLPAVFTEENKDALVCLPAISALVTDKQHCPTAPCKNCQLFAGWTPENKELC
jgi:hypothetical protein